MFVHIMDVPYLQGEAQSDSGRKRKRTPQPTSTPLVEGVELNTNAPEVEQIQTSNALQPNGDSEHVGDGENHDSGDGWEDEDNGNGWEDEEMDEENRPGCVEVELKHEWLVASYMVRKIGNLDPRFGMSSAKSMWLVLLLKDNAITAVLRLPLSEVQELVL